MEKIWILVFPVITILFATMQIGNVYSEDPESLSQMSIEEAKNDTSVETSVNDTFAPSETPESLSQMSIEEALEK